MRSFDDTSCAYAAGRIQAIENRLMSSAHFEALLHSKTPSDALRILSDAGYKAAGDIKKAEDYEDALSAETAHLYSLLYELAPEGGILDIFLLKNDYHNLKVLIKEEFLKNPAVNDEKIFIPNGSIPADKLALLYVNRDFSSLNHIMKRAILSATDDMRLKGDPQMADIILDRAQYAQMTEAATEIGNEYVINLITAMTDLSNIKTFYRIKKLGKPLTFLEKALLDGGNLGKSLFFECFGQGLDSFFERIRLTKYGSVVPEGEVTLLNLEKLSNKYIMSCVHFSRFSSMGIEPLVGYLFKKEEEIKKVRIIMVGKINKLDIETIRERIS